MLDPLHQVFQFLRFDFESNAMVAPSIAVLPACTIFDESRLGYEPDALRRFDVEMAPESAREIENVDVVEIDAVAGEDGMQARDVRALGLGQFVDIALEEKDVLVWCFAASERDALNVILEAAHSFMRPVRSSSLSSIDQAGTADAFGRDIADDTKSKRRRRRRSRPSSIAPSSAGMPQAIAPPSKAGPAGQDAARMRCLLPTINSVFVPMSMIATRRSSCARSTASMQAAASAPTWPLMIGSAVHARLG